MTNPQPHPATTEEMKSLTVFYDAHCRMCCRFRRWLKSNPVHLTLRFVPYHSAEAKLVLPEIDLYDPEKELLVLADNGNLYRGADAWIMCLWATHEYRPLSTRLAGKTLKPMVRRVCVLVSENRYRLSKLLLSNNDATMAATLDRVEEPKRCADGEGTCRIENTDRRKEITA